AKGFLRTNRGIMMLGAAPVLDGSGHGPTRGMVMMGRLLTDAEVASIGARVQAALSTILPTGNDDSQRLHESDDVTHVYQPLDDLYGHPVLTLHISVPREITFRGRTAIGYASACLLAAAVVVLIVLVAVLNRVVLAPLARVTSHAVEIGQDRDLTTR